MGALVVNGMEVPIAVDKADLGAEEIGASRKRMTGGALSLSRTATARTFEGGTSWLRREEARAWAGLFSGRGDVWHLDSETISTKKNDAQSGAATVNYRTSEIIAHAVGTTFTHPKFGSGCAALEDATKNILTSAQSQGSTAASTAGFTAVAGGSLASVTTQFWQGTRSIEVTAASSGDGVYVDAAAEASAQHAGSLYMKAASGTLAVTVKLRNETTTTDGTAKTVTLNTSWQRVEVLSPATVTATDELRLIVTAGAAGVFYVDGLQIEAKVWSTTWHAGGTTSTAGALAYKLYELRDTDDLTISLWTRGPFAGTGHAIDTAETFLFAIGDSSNRLEVRQPSATAGNAEQYARTVVSGTTTDNLLTTTFGQGVAPDDWTHVVIVMRRNPQTGSHKIECYTNGVLGSGYTDPSSLPSFGRAPTLRVGADYAGNNRWNGLIDDLVVLPYGLTADQIADVYASGRAFSNLPDLEISGDLVGLPASMPLRMVPSELPRLTTAIAKPSGATSMEPVHQVAVKLVEREPLAAS